MARRILDYVPTREELIVLLQRHDGNLSEVSAVLGWHRSTLYRHLGRLGIRPEGARDTRVRPSREELAELAALAPSVSALASWCGTTRRNITRWLDADGTPRPDGTPVKAGA